MLQVMALPLAVTTCFSTSVGTIKVAPSSTKAQYAALVLDNPDRYQFSLLCDQQTVSIYTLPVSFHLKSVLTSTVAPPVRSCSTNPYPCCPLARSKSKSDSLLMGILSIVA